MLNSAEHKILNAHKYKKYQEIQYCVLSIFFSRSYKRFLLINVKMPTIVGTVTFMNTEEKFRAQLS